MALAVTTADSIVDAIVDALKTDLAETEFSLQVTVESREKPDFDLIDAKETTAVYVSAAPNAGLKRGARQRVDQDIGIAIGVVKQVKKSGGQIDQTEFRELKSLMQFLYVWAHAGVSPYQGQVKDVSLPAWYDLQKAISPGSFLSVITMTYQTKLTA